MQRLYTIAEKKRRPNWNCCCTSFEVLHPLRLVDPEKKSRHYFLEDFLWQLSFWGDFLGLDPPLYVVVALLFETLFWRGANKHIWQDLVRHMIAVKSRTLQPLRVQVTRYAMCDKYGSCGFSTSFSFPHSWNMRIGAADTGNCKNWIKRVENKWFPNVLLLLHTLYFSECEKEGESKAKNCIRRSLFWEREEDLEFFCTDGVFCIRTPSTCWNFCFHSLLGFLVHFPEASLKVFFGLEAIGHVKKTMQFPRDLCLENWPQSLTIAPHSHLLTLGGQKAILSKEKQQLLLKFLLFHPMLDKTSLETSDFVPTQWKQGAFCFCSS